MTLSKVEELIAQERGKLEDALALAVERRDVANREVKRIRAELDAAPRLHVRRTRKTPGRALADEVVADLELTSDGKINVRAPSALEMFPHGIERVEKGV